jgi:cell division protein FtsQ
MGRNRLRRPSGRFAAVVVERTGDWLRHSVKGLLLLMGLALLAAAGWSMVQRSTYFNIRTIEVGETPHLDRALIATLVGLDGPVNLFRFDARGAEEALAAHPWVASARVEKRMPDRVEIHLSERVPAAVVAIGALYIVDADGQPFIRATPAEAVGLPLVTGLSRELFESEPSTARARVREALALGRQYLRSPMSAARPLSNIHVGDGGRLELMLGRTRVVMGQGDLRAKLERLEQVYETLTLRGVDASYILMDEKGHRSIVKEIAAARPVMGSL